MWGCTEEKQWLPFMVLSSLSLTSIKMASTNPLSEHWNENNDYFRQSTDFEFKKPEKGLICYTEPSHSHWLFAPDLLYYYFSSLFHQYQINSTNKRKAQLFIYIFIPSQGGCNHHESVVSSSPPCPHRFTEMSPVNLTVREKRCTEQLKGLHW